VVRVDLIFVQNVAGLFRPCNQKGIISHGSIFFKQSNFCTENENVSRTFNNKNSHVAHGGIANFVVKISNFVRSRG
jgi:hypothetical protein